MEAHRLAKYFPLLEGDEFNLLVEDIRKNGQLEPIVTVDGEILDGLNRYRACQEIGIEPVTEEYTGDDPLGYVVSLNVRRRHMDTSQRAMLATEMLPEFEAQAKERIETSRDEGGRYAPFVSVDTNGKPNYNETTATAEAAKEFNVARVTVARAKRVKEQAPEKVADIVAGKTSVRAVDTELREARAEMRHAERKDRDDARRAT